MFKTAGVLLDEMLDKGLSALKYKVIILDEVHERSVESDLVLVCVKQFLMKNTDLRFQPLSIFSSCSSLFKISLSLPIQPCKVPTEIQPCFFFFFLQGCLNVCNC